MTRPCMTALNYRIIELEKIRKETHNGTLIKRAGLWVED